MVNKNTLQSFIAKYYINGLNNQVKWRIKDNTLTVYAGESGRVCKVVLNDFSFEESVLKDISNKCEVHTFDPTIGSNPSNKPANVQFHPWGLSQRSHGNMKTVKDIISILGHETRKIDIFKIDCEGCEWETFSTWFEVSNIHQIQVELHNVNKAIDFFEKIIKNGYVVFHKEPNIAYSNGGCIEYAFIKMSEGFFS